MCYILYYLCCLSFIYIISYVFVVWFLNSLFSPLGSPHQLWVEKLSLYNSSLDFPGGASGKEPHCQCKKCKRCGFDHWVEKIPWRRAWQPTPVLFPREFNGQRRQAGYSPRGHRVRRGWRNLACTLVALYISF